MPYCRSCGNYFESALPGSEHYEGEQTLCSERCMGPDMEMELLEIERVEAAETFGLDSAISTLFAPEPW